MRRVILLMIALVLLAGTMLLGVRGAGLIPPLGPLLDPANGAWALAEGAEAEDDVEAEIPGLQASVRIVRDDRGVPHIFAESQEDALRALGWAVARDRLFQLEVQARAGAGTLAALVGRQGIGIDRQARALGFARAAERRLAAIDTSGREWRALVAYAQGVNAWIDGLHVRDIPLEYRLLGARPARWEPVNSVHLLHRMGWTLAHGEEELTRLLARSKVGAAAADALFPIHAPLQEPIQPFDGTRGRYTPPPLPPPGAPELDAAIVAELIGALRRGSDGAGRAAGDALGSNNWAVAPSRTANGHALLAGDPHLELSLPSIWYEAHLVVPDSLDVYGVTLPGAPMIVIGFNRDIAWTFTNTQADVLDLYRETVDDHAAPARYRMDGEWRAIEVREERHVDRRGALLATDTVRYTHRGPMRRMSGEWVSMRWTVLERGHEIEAFLGAMSARNVADFLDATAGYAAPAQNMLVADRWGSIAIRSTGRFPIRPGNGRGDLVRDGSSLASDWTGAWPLERYPRSIDPARGFLQSANQQPIHPEDDPGYLGAGWPPPWRAMRITDLLHADSLMTVDDMRRMQVDAGSARADRFVPAFLAAGARASEARIARATALLREWDRRYDRANERAVLFEYAMRELDERLWDELQGEGGARAVFPGDMITAQLLAHEHSEWWDVRGTPQVETRDDLLAASLGAALDRALRMHGEPDSGQWRWSERRQARIDHLLGLPALSVRGIPVASGPSTLSPSSGSGRHGASWRMVVELAPEVRGWGVYPGGQSGNPFSRRYSDGIERWAAGALDTLRFPRQPDAVEGRVSRVLLRVPERTP